VFNEINARKLKHAHANPFHLFFNNRLFLIIILTTIVAQLLTVWLASSHVRTVPLSFKENLLCLIIGSTSLLSALLFKTIMPGDLKDEAY
jgi:Ca2+-transporting ATPase